MSQKYGIMKKIIAIILVLMTVFASIGCADNSTVSKEDTGENATTAEDVESADTSAEDVEITSTVTENKKFGSATVALSQEEFEAAGFELGDAVNVIFENGTVLFGVPYFNGYYVKQAYPVVVAYPGDSNVVIAYNNESLWSLEGLKDGEGVTISMCVKGGYKTTHEALGQKYSMNREDYDSDEAFCNFRELKGGSLKAGLLYRGASPVDNSRGRASYADSLIKDKQIACIINLADSKEDIEKYRKQDDFASPYADDLIKQDKVALLDMASAYQKTEYQKKVAEGMRKLLSTGGPAYIHCMEGKDRTGFVCLLIEAFCGATYDEMRADYMKTYENYFSITEDGTPEKYTAIKELYFDAFMSYLYGVDDLETLKEADYSWEAEQYLKKGGMTDEEIEALKAFLM